MLLPPSPPAKKRFALFSLAGRASGCSIIVAVLVRRPRLSQESGTAQHQFANRRDDTGEILADAKVFEAKDNDSSRQQHSIALSIRVFVVMRSIQLDRDLRTRTIEIDDEGAERVLAANRNSQPRSAQLRPEDGFFGRRTPSELTRSFEHMT